MKKFIKNSDGQSLCVQIFEPDIKQKQPKLAVICHGITGYKEQDVIEQTSKTLINCGYTVVTFDCRNSRGESFNNCSCATLSSMADDLQTVISWLQTQVLYIEPFLLAGHSLGGSVVLDYAQKHTQVVSHLILLSTIFDGNEFLQNLKKYTPEFLHQLKNGGIIRSRNQTDCFLDDSFLQNLKTYDLYQNVPALKMPLLIIGGDKDTASDIKSNERFYSAVQSKKQLRILPNCSHIYDAVQNQSDLNDTITKFLTADI
ncbi:MAG: alpha/beta hydrolase [Alphaproteobacteria bacterium]|nr:alpha/beta hydrolase [Alphaproteobacteria bacterium]